MFVDSRFGAIGPCGRKWLLSCALGLDVCFAMTLARGPDNVGLLRQRISEAKYKVRLWLTTAAFSAMPVESMVLELLEDDRLLLRADYIRESMAAETSYVSKLPITFFAEIACIADLPLSGELLKHETLRSLHVGCGYVYGEAWHHLKCDPLALTQGDIAANVAALSERTLPPREYATRQMWHALRACFPDRRLVRTLLLLRDSPSTTGLAEKGHGMGAGVMTRHKMISTDTVTARALSSESRAFVAERKEDLAMDSLKRKVDELTDFKSRVNAKHMYCRRVMIDKEAEREGNIQAMEDNARSVAEHHSGWLRLDMADRIEFAAQAKQENARRSQAARAQLEEARARLAFLTKRKEYQQSQESGDPTTLSALRFTNADVDRMAKTFSGPEFRGERAASQWKALLTPPEMPQQDVRDAIDAEGSKMEAENPKAILPWWASILIQRREDFANAAIAFSSENGAFDFAYYFLLGKKGVDKK